MRNTVIGFIFLSMIFSIFADNHDLMPLYPMDNGTMATSYMNWIQNHADLYEPYLKETNLHGISALHRSFYGDQEIYLYEFKKMVLFIVWLLNFAPEYPFRDLIIKLGDGRQKIAQASGDTMTLFGTLRTSGKCVVTPVFYGSDDIRKFSKVIISYLNEKQEPCMTMVDGALVNLDDFVTLKKVNHYEYYGNRAKKILERHNANIYRANTFHEDVAALVTLQDGIVKIFNDACVDEIDAHSLTIWQILSEQWREAQSPSEILSELAECIGRFHWYWAQVSPFDRGSASIGEMLADALWLYHGYLPPVPGTVFDDELQGYCNRSLDLEALIPEDGRGLICLSGYFANPEELKGIHFEKNPEVTRLIPHAEDLFAQKYLSFMSQSPRKLAHCS